MSRESRVQEFLADVDNLSLEVKGVLLGRIIGEVLRVGYSPDLLDFLEREVQKAMAEFNEENEDGHINAVNLGMSLERYHSLRLMGFSSFAIEDMARLGDK